MKLSNIIKIKIKNKNKKEPTEKESKWLSHTHYDIRKTVEGGYVECSMEKLKE